MNRSMQCFLLLLAAGLLAACGDKQGSGRSAKGSEADHGHDHDEGGDHDHDGADPDDHAHGERFELGSTEIGGQSVTLACLGQVEAGKEAVLAVGVEGAKPAAVRAWVGVESGKGSMKTKLHIEDGAHHGHLEVPATLPEGSAIWIELEAADGTRAKGSFQRP